MVERVVGWMDFSGFAWWMDFDGFTYWCSFNFGCFAAFFTDNRICTKHIWVDAVMTLEWLISHL